jgi:hypothetical protein
MTNKFEIGEFVVLNEHVQKDLPKRVGEVVEVVRIIKSRNYDYDIQYSDGDYNPVKEIELNKLTESEKELTKYIKKDNQVIYSPTGEIVTIKKIDLLHGQIEIEFEKGWQVVGIETLKQLDGEICNVEEKQQEKLGYFADLGLQVGKLVDEKQKAYGDSVTKAYEIMKVLLNDYHDEKNRTYVIPESLLEIILLDVRKIDKLNRRFSNPDGDLMDENPFKDDVGYSLLGMRMVDNVK